jgi:hypothetical protein
MEDVSVFALLARLVVSLGVVLGLMWVAAKLLARQSGGGRALRAARPAAVLQLDVPVGRIDGRTASPSLWAALLTERMAA